MNKLTTTMRLITALSLALLAIEMWHVARAAIDFHNLYNQCKENYYAR